MRMCTQCGGRLERIHRSFVERFAYMAIYECSACKDISSVPRRYRYHLGKHARCPKCGTLRITKLRVRDHIDPLSRSPLNLLERICGGALFHCRYCRWQFYDRRNALPEKPPAQSAKSPEAVAPAGR